MTMTTSRNDNAMWTSILGSDFQGQIFAPNCDFDNSFNQRRVPEYQSVLEPKHDTLGVKSGLDQGKSFACRFLLHTGGEHCHKDWRLRTFGKDVISCIIVANCIPLCADFRKNFPDFKLYSDIKGKIHVDEYPLVIVTVDSLHRVCGKYDLFIMDEVESIKRRLLSTDEEACVNENAKLKIYNAIIAHSQ